MREVRQHGDGTWWFDGLQEEIGPYDSAEAAARAAEAYWDTLGDQ